MGGAAIQDDRRVRDPLLRAIGELRDQVERLIDDQKAAVLGFAGAFEPEPVAADRGVALAAEPVASPQFLAPEPVLAPAPKSKRPPAPLSFDRVDEPSSVPPRPSSAPATPAEPAPGGRAEDPRERLDALAKHLDRKLRQAGGPAAEPSGRPAE